MTYYLWKKTQFEWQADFSSETIDNRREWHNIFKCWKKRTVNPQSTSSENILQEWRGNQDVPRWWKTKKICCQYTYPKRMAKGSSLNQTKMIKEGILEHQEGRKNMARAKNKDEYK